MAKNILGTAIFNRYVREKNTQEKGLQSHSGQPVVVVAELNPRDYDKDEVGTMYLVLFNDDSYANVFQDELTWTSRSRHVNA